LTSALFANDTVFSASANCTLVDSTVLDRTLIKFSLFDLYCLRLAWDNLSFAEMSDFLRSAAFLTADSTPFFAELDVVEAVL
jgi:hypothetical protein